ncbi:MAG: twin-arginine translocase subunit TatC [Gammaproteobacteria bacterium]|nr:MAG: twin-arginine translocase subunit TatC [Gammaproteobacteria bacterium]
MTADNNSLPAEEEQGFIAHLIELRDRLLRVVLVVLLVFLVLFPVANTLYSFLAAPLLEHLPQGSSMIAVDVITPFLTPMKLALVSAIFIAMPYVLYQAWLFVAPGLYRREKRLAMPLLASSVVLFYVGIAFAYFVVFPLVFSFLIGVAPEGVAVMTDISRYLDFVLTLFFAFGLAFEVPIATIILVVLGITTPDALSAKRPYVIVGAFVVGMLLTPPDIISQILLALPMWLLFEIGIYFSRIIVRSRPAVEEEAPVSKDVEAAPDMDQSTTDEADDDWQPPTEAQMDAELDELELEDDEPGELKEGDDGHKT